MNKIKVFFHILCIAMIVFSLTACMTDHYIEHHPASNLGATYVSSEGDIILFISEKEGTEVHNGYFIYDGTQIDVVFTGVRLVSNCITMQTKEQYEEGSDERIVTFRYSRFDQNKIVVEVTKDTSYFKEGETRTLILSGDGSLR